MTGELRIIFKIIWKRVIGVVLIKISPRNISRKYTFAWKSEIAVLMFFDTFDNNLIIKIDFKNHLKMSCLCCFGLTYLLQIF